MVMHMHTDDVVLRRKSVKKVKPLVSQAKLVIFGRILFAALGERAGVV